jgi:hypothetical protein
LRAELRELTAQAAVEDEVAHAGDETADQLRVDADGQIDLAADAAHQRGAHAIELGGVERRGGHELALHAAGRLLREPHELVADGGEIARAALVDQVRAEVREERREPERTRELREEAAEIAVRLAGDILKRSVGDADRAKLVDDFVTGVESSREPAARS